MGICSGKDNERRQSKPQNQISINPTNTGVNSKKNNQNVQEETLAPKFNDMPEWEGDKFKGYGIKQMKGYKCSLKINELNQLRDEFWASRKTHKAQWTIVHQACIYDHIKAEEYLYKNNMKTLNGCINQCVDSMNNIYRVPNFCINDPYFELEVLPDDQSHRNPIEIILFDLCIGKQIKLNVNESTKGIELKQKYAEKHNIDLSKNIIRLLFGGGIIKDEESLYQHKVKNGFSIQICVSPIE